MLSIKIEEDKAEAKRKLAGGDRDFNKITADGESYKLKTVADGNAYAQREVGRGIADAYRAQAEVIGKEATAAIKIMDEVGVNNVKITPDILISGSNGDSGAVPLLSTFLAQTVSKTLETSKKDQTQAAPKN
jgi:hypothetical protein